MVRFRRRLLALLVPLAILAVLVAASMLWLDRQSARARIAEAQLGPALARAEAAEARAARAEASLTAIGEQQIATARATATAAATVNEPQRALERALGRLFAAFQDPTGSSFDQLGDSFSPGALQVLRAEVDYLRSSGRHLGGASTFSLDAAPIQRIGEDRASVHTNERWLYDERDESDRRQRCFIEDSEQTYVLRMAGRNWLIDEVQLGATRRSDCPPGT
jgi:type II secretory pathway pseudopilin PulG